MAAQSYLGDLRSEAEIVELIEIDEPELGATPEPQ